MRISRTPLRVSFFGGGTDYPEYYRHHPGAVLGTSIDKYIYINALRLEPFIGCRYRLSYRVNEEVNSTDEIEHPVFRVVIKEFDLEGGWNFGVMSSLPARSGLGSSSSFTVGLINLIAHIRGESLTPEELAKGAIHVERGLLSENVGTQDQLHAAYGGLRRYDFSGDSWTVTPMRVNPAVRDALNQSMYLIHTGVARYASEIASEQIKRTSEHAIDRPLAHLYDLAQEACVLLERDDPEFVVREFSRMLDDGWRTKRELSRCVTTPAIDELHDELMNSGALGGKLCGAGGGGFFLAIIPPHLRERVQSKLKHRTLIPIAMNDAGSTILST